jgi:hypothetical protein
VWIRCVRCILSKDRWHNFFLLRRQGLEDDFQGELAYAWVAGALNVAEVGRVGGGIWVVEIGVVENVEELGVELEAETLAGAECEVFERADVPGDEGGTVECSLGGVAVGAEWVAGVGVDGDE